MLMCKYNLFIVMCKNEYRELYVSKEPILGSTCSVYCASRGTCVIHEKKKKIGLTGIQNSSSFFAESQSRT